MEGIINKNEQKNFSTTWISVVYQPGVLVAHHTEVETILALMAMALGLELMAAKLDQHPAAIRLSDSLVWPEGPKGIRDVHEFHFCFFKTFQTQRNKSIERKMAKAHSYTSAHSYKYLHELKCIYPERLYMIYYTRRVLYLRHLRLFIFFFSSGFSRGDIIFFIFTFFVFLHYVQLRVNEKRNDYLNRKNQDIKQDINIKTNTNK